MSKIKFELRRGSDVLRDGMYMELSVSETFPLRQVAEVFYSDVTQEFFLTYYEENIPLEAVEKLISVARISLPPVK
jgi:ribosome recycling factor